MGGPIVQQNSWAEKRRVTSPVRLRWKARQSYIIERCCLNLTRLETRVDDVAIRLLDFLHSASAGLLLWNRNFLVSLFSMISIAWRCIVTLNLNYYHQKTVPCTHDLTQRFFDVTNLSDIVTARISALLLRCSERMSQNGFYFQTLNRLVQL